MRTAVVRVQVDPAGRLTPEQLIDGMAALRGLTDATDIGVLQNNIAEMPPSRREVELLMLGGDAEQLKRDAVALCAKAFGTAPTPGVITYLVGEPTTTRTVCSRDSASPVRSPARPATTASTSSM